MFKDVRRNKKNVNNCILFTLSAVILMKSTGENIRFMGRKYLLIFTAVFFIVLFPLSSRSLFDVGLKVVTLYDVDEAVESDGFFQG